MLVNTNHLVLHGLGQVLDLCHGYPVRQVYEVCVNALACPLCIRTHDIFSSSPPSMTRETFWPSWSYMCIHMIDCHYVSSHQNMSFESIYQKTQKKIQNLKSGFGILYLCRHNLLLLLQREILMAWGTTTDKLNPEINPSLYARETKHITLKDLVSYLILDG